MRTVVWAVGLLAAAFAAMHLYFFWAVGTFDPCHAAMLRIVQKDRQAGDELNAQIGILFGRQLEDLIRAEGVLACYRSALKGEPPETHLRFNR